MQFSRPLIILSPVLASALALSACSSGTPEEDAPEPQATPADQSEATPKPGETVSILRPELEGSDTVEVEPLEPLTVVVGFPDGGLELDANAVAALETVLKSEQLETGAPITLASHTDSAGSDSANEAASEKRGLAVAAWLIEQGISEERITVIAFGEQNPIAPNALADGSPNDEGRAKNRRVELTIIPLEVAQKADGASQEEDTSAETRYEL